jgi:hypothetical protein
MNMGAETVTLTFPRSAIGGVVSLAAALIDGMHELLERNTDGALSETERDRLETLVQMAQFGQIVSASLQVPAR